MATPVEDGKWAKSLFGCFDNINICLYGWCCAPCLYGSTNGLIEEGGCMMAALTMWCCGPCTICCCAPGRRKKIRAVGDLPEEPCGDCVVWICCPSCANCQEYNELFERNIEKQSDYDNAVTALKNKGVAPGDGPPA